MGWVLDHSESEGTARLVLLAIANHADPVGENSWASVARIAREANKSVRSVQRALRDLEAAQEIAPMGPKPGARRDRATTTYEMPRFAAWLEATHGVTPASPRGSNGVTPVVERGDTGDANGVTPLSPEPPLEPPIEPKEQDRALDDRFAEFWSIWPKERRQGTGKAREAFANAVAGKAVQGRKRPPTDPAAIIAGARRFAEDPNLPHDEPTFIPYASTWLNQDRWLDGPLAPRRSNGNGRRSGTVDTAAIARELEAKIASRS